jgi:hypothetical protein
MRTKRLFPLFAGAALCLTGAAALAREDLSKDVLVTVQETRTGSLLFGVGVNSDAGLTGSIVVNERNFDVKRLPLVPFDDLLSGRLFQIPKARGNK